jgi:RNA polymerase sigma factor (sigma-70 family)
MEQLPASATHASLLRRLAFNPADPAAWEEFVQRYGRRIYLWCRFWNLQDADAEDVTQNVLVEIARQMGKFQYDPARSFRAWLKTITHGAWCDFLSRHPERHRGSGDSQVFLLLQSVEARDDLARSLEEEHDRNLLEQASALVRLRVDGRTWEAFQLLALEGLSGKEVAQRLGIKIGAAFMAKSRVQKMLQDEIARLENPAETCS